MSETNDGRQLGDDRPMLEYAAAQPHPRHRGYPVSIIRWTRTVEGCREVQDSHYVAFHDTREAAIADARQRNHRHQGWLAQGDNRHD